jgi:hypothetical protein
MNTPTNSEALPHTSGSLVFPISTLRDIFNLPTRSQMETCLREMSEGMVQARIASDTIVEAMLAAGVTDITRAVEWPEVANWTDDGKGDVTTRFGGPDKVPVFTLHGKVDPEND